MPISNRIKELRLHRDLSLQELADMVGTTKSQISRLENSDRRLTDQWMVKIAHALKCAPADLLPPSATASHPMRVIDLQSFPYDLPLHPLRALSSPGGSQNLEGYQLSEDSIEFRRRPPGVATSPEAYCTYIPADALNKFDRGDLVVVRPDRPAKIGDPVLLTVRSSPGENPATFIGRLVQADRAWTTLSVDRPSPMSDKFATSHVVSCHKILSTEEMLGF